MKPVEHLSDDELAGQVQRAVQALPDAPPSWQRAAVDLWRTASSAADVPTVAQTAKALARLVMATLAFDSWAVSGPALGMRSSRNPTRHLLYSAQGRDIDLRITPAAEHFTLSGQILGPDETGRIELAPARAPAAASHSGGLDALGEFRLDGVAAGRYVLTLHVGAESIVVEAVDVGDPAT